MTRPCPRTTSHSYVSIRGPPMSLSPVARPTFLLIAVLTGISLVVGGLAGWGASALTAAKTTTAATAHLGCVDVTTKSLTLISPSQSCPTGLVPVVWQTAAAKDGKTGPAGPTGSAGPAGVQGRQRGDWTPGGTPAAPAPLALRAPPAPRVPQGRPEPPDRRASPDPRGLQERPARPAQRGTPGRREPRVTPARPVRPEMPDPPEPPDSPRGPR